MRYGSRMPNLYRRVLSGCHPDAFAVPQGMVVREWQRGRAIYLVRVRSSRLSRRTTSW